MNKEFANKKLNFDFNLEVAIKTRDLNLYYESFQALKNINIDINKNSVTAFIGPSGCIFSTSYSGGGGGGIA